MRPIEVAVCKDCVGNNGNIARGDSNGNQIAVMMVARGGGGVLKKGADSSALAVVICVGGDGWGMAILILT